MDAEELPENINTLLIDTGISTDDDNVSVVDEITFSEELNVANDKDEEFTVVWDTEAIPVVIVGETDCCSEMDTEDNLCEETGDGSSFDELLFIWDVVLKADINPFVVKLNKDENPCVAKLEFITDVVESNILVLYFSVEEN